MCKITFVCIKYPCNACIIVQGLVTEVIQKVLTLKNVEYEQVTISNLSDIYNVPGLEVELFPALLINNEQVTAGNIISTNQLLKLIDSIIEEE